MRDKLNVKTCFTHKELLDKAIKKNCHEHFGILKNIKFELSSSKKLGFICFNESPLKMMNNAFYFILKAFLFLRDLQFCPDFFGYVGKQLYKKAMVNFKIYDITNWETNNYNTHIAQHTKM